MTTSIMKRSLDFTTATQYLLLEGGGGGVLKKEGVGKKGFGKFQKGDDETSFRTVDSIVKTVCKQSGTRPHLRIDTWHLYQFHNLYR